MFTLISKDQKYNINCTMVDVRGDVLKKSRRQQVFFFSFRIYLCVMKRTVFVCSQKDTPKTGILVHHVFSIYFSLSVKRRITAGLPSMEKLYSHGTSRPPLLSFDLCLLSVILHEILPPWTMKNLANTEMSLGICPTVTCPFLTATQCLSPYLSPFILEVTKTYGGEKKHFTTVLAVNTAGEYLPTMTIFKGKRELQISAPTGWVVAANNKAWMREDVMLRWIREILRPYTQRRPSHNSCFSLVFCAHNSKSVWRTAQNTMPPSYHSRWLHEQGSTSGRGYQ